MERHPLCRKIYLELAPPTEEDARGDRERILDGLTGEHTTAVMPLQVMRKLYPLCRRAEWKVTLLMGFHDGVWEILDIEAGNTTGQLREYDTRDAGSGSAHRRDVGAADRL